MQKVLKVLGFVLLLIVVLYFVGPKAEKANLDPKLPIIETNINTVEAYVTAQEAAADSIKPNNATSIIWSDSTQQKTKYAIIYLHGFSASAMEGHPVHVSIAKKYGYNLYLPRLSEHGIQSENAFLHITAEKLVASAKEALAIGKILGDSVVLMSCSTGGTLSLYLAAHHQEISSLIMYAPNVEVADKTSKMLTKPWGLQIARKVMGSKFYGFEAGEEMKKYWTTRYRIEGLVALQALLDATMNKETFKKITQPTFVGYYYKNEDNKDEVVSIPRINEMFEQLSTPKSLKRKVEFPNAEAHSINSAITAKNVDKVIQETEKFCEEILGWHPKID